MLPSEPRVTTSFHELGMAPLFSKHLVMRATGKLEHDAHRSTRSTRISRADLARFLADVVEQQQYVGKAPFVASSA